MTAGEVDYYGVEELLGDEERMIRASVRICWLTADWVTKFWEAAVEKLRVSTTSQKTFRVSRCIANV